MDDRFKQRARLLPPHRAAIAILHARPEIGLVVRAQPGPLRDNFLAELRRSSPWSHARTIAQRDIRQLSEKRSRVSALAVLDDETPADNPDHPLILTGADRYGASEAAHLLPQLDAARPIIALDEGLGDETLPDALLDRLGIWLDLTLPDPDANDLDPGIDPVTPTGPLNTRAISVPESAIATLCEAASAFGIPSLRAPLLALDAARASAAIMGAREIADEDVLLACRLVLAPRARQAPSFDEQPPEEDSESEDHPDASNDDTPPQDHDEPDQSDSEKSETNQEASSQSGQDTDVQSEDVAIPLDILKRLAAMVRNHHTAGKTARKGATARSGGARGRPLGSRAGDPRHSSLDISATLTAALPWQRFRRQRFPRLTDRPVILTPSDIRIRRLQAKRETATIFVVDASGSAALARLAEAKGAIERILAECYRRRDRVAMVAFRGTSAETLLPETKSLTRARRALAGLSAGGGTPLASGIALAGDLARQCERQERTPLIVFLTDGKANITLDGMAGRSSAREDVNTQATVLRSQGYASLVIDFSLRPGPHAHDLADMLGGRYLALPNGDASSLADAVARDPSKSARP
ncbi:von Willebrand factor, type A [Fulvimarina pelagi HTCC2506]|uniref:von Willebrand factor, type A n=1 Tax=Fulvimarina pelagi HTCC2506 TaxID=314231 RepID=Q0FYU3_9HYPH|nr:VWA domain-containing protein [Fulvimarina pelagi]EAU40215.1 von Willebrand factor, type A [Fulvimarina pelagi HTCC2506]